MCKHDKLRHNGRTFIYHKTWQQQRQQHINLTTQRDLSQRQRGPGVGPTENGAVFRNTTGPEWRKLESSWCCIIQSWEYGESLKRNQEVLVWTFPVLASTDVSSHHHWLSPYMPEHVCLGGFGTQDCTDYQASMRLPWYHSCSTNLYWHCQQPGQSAGTIFKCKVWGLRLWGDDRAVWAH